jgi:hypothetical protein
LIASLALVSKYGMPPLDWQKVMARFDEICSTISKTRVHMIKPTHHALALLHINLVANDNLRLSVPYPSNDRRDTYEWEALRIHGAGLDQELVAPAVQCIETLGVVDVVYEHAAVGAAVEGHA